VPAQCACALNLHPCCRDAIALRQPHGPIRAGELRAEQWPGERPIG
jgi:hypothetical protein